MTISNGGLPPDEAQRLAAFVGEWTIGGSIASPDGRAAISGTWRFEGTANGWGVLGIMDTEIEGMGAFEENELIGFDGVEEKVHLFSMNKFAIRDHVGGWLDENMLRVRYTSETAGKLVTEEITIEFVVSGRMVGHVLEREGGVVVVTTDLMMDRRS